MKKRTSTCNNKGNSDLLTHPVKHFDALSNSGISEILEAFKGTSFQSRNLAKCCDILLRMLQDPDRPIIFLGLAGALVPGGLRSVIREMIKMHVVDVLVSTGANLYHDLHEALGFHHYIARKHVPDWRLREKGVDRIYDVYADDEEFYESDLYVERFANKLEPRIYSTREFLYLLGLSLPDDKSILATAAQEGVPIFCPAIADSSIGIALASHQMNRSRQNLKGVVLDTIKDNLEILNVSLRAKKTAAIIIGGGVPKNYIQQLAPMAEVLQLPPKGHSYGIQITTDDPKWGGLSGCSFEEGQSWGKYGRDARFATVYMDATIGLPLLFKAVVEKKDSWYPRESILAQQITEQEVT